MKISIITVCYNAEKTIKDTIESVLKQSYTNFEYIIVDGKSSDNTLNIISKYQDNRIRLISEKDNGLYDAMNKGINMAKGDIIATLNSDDILANGNIFQTVIDNFDKNTDVIYANIKYFNEDFSKVKRDFISGTKENDYFCPAHPSMYVRKEVYQRIGAYNTNYKIAADFDFMVRCNTHNIRYKYVDEYFVYMRYGGKSNGFVGYLENYKECLKILRKNKVSFPLTKTTLRSIHTIKQIIKG